MNQDNFIDTVCKKLNLDYSKGKLGVEEDFLSLFNLMDVCEYFLDFTEQPSELSGVKQAFIHVKSPIENKAVFEKYGQVIADTAKDLYGTRDGYTICGLVCDVLVPEAQVV